MKLASAIVLAAVLLAGGSTAILSANGPETPAKSTWAKKHPRRHQVNRRLRHQNKRITRKEKDGQMTQAQGQALRQNDKDVRSEEKDMAGQDGGHITQGDQKALNQQENQNSRAIANQ
jgi:hypothetical protein